MLTKEGDVGAEDGSVGSVGIMELQGLKLSRKEEDGVEKQSVNS